MMPEMETYFQTCLSRALDSEDVQEQIKWLEKALEVDPKRVEDVLRVASGLQSLSSGTSGKAYIAELKKLIPKRKRRRKRKST